MWRTLAAFAFTIAIAQSMVYAQETSAPYGPFDAIAEGTARSEAQRLALIESQLDASEQLRLAQMTFPRPLLRDSRSAAVIPYGRRGILGLRPRGYIIVPRAPGMVYPPSNDAPPPRYSSGYSIRQPIGHQLSRTGPNRWEYRPLYADDDIQLDEMHRQIERDLRPLPDFDAAPAGYAADGERAAPTLPRENAPEELPEPDAIEQERPAATANRLPHPREVGGSGVRDIARDASLMGTQTSREQVAGSARRDNRVPPPPTPDPPNQPPSPVAASKPPVSDAAAPPDESPALGADEIRGPLLQNPNPNAREF